MNNFALINAYTRAMNPTGIPRIQERMEQKAEGILSKATSQEAYQRQAEQLWKEVGASQRAVSDTATKGRQPLSKGTPMPQPEGKTGAPKAPAVGTVEDGFRFRGGDPTKAESWQPVK